MNRNFNVCAVGFGVIACFIMFWTDFKKSDILPLPHCLLTTRPDDVAQATKQSIRPLSVAAIASTKEPVMEKLNHLLLVDWLPEIVPEYTYSPILSWIFSPLNLLPQSWSLFVFQLLSMGALIGSVYKLVSLHEEKEHWSVQTIILSFASLAFLPVLMALKIGAVDFIAGIFPLSFGYYFLVKRRPVKAGLLLSLTIFKPQYLLTAFFVASAMVVDKKRQKCLASLMVGITLIALIDMAAFHAELVKEIFRCFTAFDEIQPGFVPQMATNFPAALLNMLPSPQQAILQPWVMVFAGFIGVLGFITALRLWQEQIPEPKKIAIAILIGMFITPFVVPGFFIQQFCLYALAAIIALLADWSAFTYWDFKSLIFMGWVLINALTAPIFCNKVFVYPLLVIFFLMLFYRRLLLVVETIRVKESTPEVPVVQN